MSSVRKNLFNLSQPSFGELVFLISRRFSLIVFVISAWSSIAAAQNLPAQWQARYSATAQALQAGDADKALTLAVPLLPLAERAFGLEHKNTIASLALLAVLYNETDKVDLAEPLYTRALEKLPSVYGPKHDIVLIVLNNLSLIYQSSARFEQAESLLNKIFNTDWPATNQNELFIYSAKHTLANLYVETGRFQNAEVQYKELLDFRVQKFGMEHQDTLNAASNLGALYAMMGQYPEAFALLKTVLDTRLKLYGWNHTDTLLAAQNLAAHQNSIREYEKSVQIIDSIMDISERLRGFDDVDHIQLIYILATSYTGIEKYEEAKALFQEVLKKYRRILGENHPRYLSVLGNIAALNERMGLFHESIDINEKLLEVTISYLGQEHPDTLRIIYNLSLSQVAQGISRVSALAAASTLRDGVLASRVWAEQEADAASAATRRQTAFVLAGLSDGLALALAAHAPMAETADLAALVVLNRKGLVGEREAALLRLARTAEAQDVRRIAEKLLVARRDLAAAYRQVAGREGDELALRLFKASTERVDGLERDLALAEPSYRAPRDVTAKEVATALPEGAVLIDYTLFRPYDFKTRKPAEGRHVGAVVLRPGAEAVFVDLGLLAVMQPAIEGLSTTLGTGDAGKIAGITLHKALLAPLAEHIAGAETLFISPAGPLGLIPFDMLRTSPSDQSTLATSGPTLRLLSTGRALVAEAPEAAGQGLVAFGAVDYEQAGGGAQTPAETGETLLALVEQARGATAETMTRAGGLQSFAPLPQTAVEINAVAEIWRATGGEAPALHIGPDAQEARLTALTEAPRVLHLATHGFVEETEAVGARAALLTGIALAGANQAGETEAATDGVLFGYEIEALDLAGTELVVVSACETGRGRADATEGIYSLARGFRLAGASAVLVTLKQVDDALTAAFIADFYKAWLGTPGTTPAEALAQTKRAWTQSPAPRRSRPDTWAAFVLVENRV